jgi:hypothetical protein
VASKHVDAAARPSAAAQPSVGPPETSPADAAATKIKPKAEREADKVRDKQASARDRTRDKSAPAVVKVKVRAHAEQQVARCVVAVDAPVALRPNVSVHA